MPCGPIDLKNISLSFPQKICFQNFSTQIHFGDRIAIMGQNGSGKSTLLKIIKDFLPQEFLFGYVPQIIEGFEEISGGQRFQKALTNALSVTPDILLLDEPTNHLDVKNKQSLIRLLRSFTGILIVVSHDEEILQTCVNTLWHINAEKIHIFCGNYDDYKAERFKKQWSLDRELMHLDRQKKGLHQDLMKEQMRSAKSQLKGKKNVENKKWSKIVSSAKASRAEETTGRKKRSIEHEKQVLNEKLIELRCSEVIKPKFFLPSSNSTSKTLASITNGTCGYGSPILTEIFLSVNACDRLAIMGNNGSGKSTLLKAILTDPSVTRSGEWVTPFPKDIGYLDQHYSNLPSQCNVLDALHEVVPTWAHTDLRLHLNTFLFRKNEEVLTKVSSLSGGEKARLSLALIAAKTPKLLILDEITNNLDLETKKHVAQVLRDYPGAFIIVSHDLNFLNSIQLTNHYNLQGI